VHAGRRGDQAIDDRQRIGDVQSAPLVGDFGVDRQDAVGVVALESDEPLVVGPRPRRIAAPEPLDAETNLADDERA
jgi:hypothetical protein